MNQPTVTKGALGARAFFHQAQAEGRTAALGLPSGRSRSALRCFLSRLHLEVLKLLSSVQEEVNRQKRQHQQREDHHEESKVAQA